MKIIAFAASNHRHSINKKLATHIAKKFDNGAEILDLNDYEMPLYSIDRQLENGIHPLATEFAKKIDNADLIILSLAEYNGTYSSAFKNIFDWVSRIANRKTFNNTKVFLASTSPGVRGGKTVMDNAKVIFPHHGAEIVSDFMLPSFGDNFDEKEGVINEEKRTELEEKINSVKTLF